MGALLEDLKALTDKDRELLFYRIKEWQNGENGASSTGGKKRLNAYITADNGLNITELRSDIHDRLPEYMVPSAIVELPEFPLLPNGKVDKRALKNIGAEQQGSQEEVLSRPLNEVEEKLTELWKEVLNLETVGIRENFFDIGGDSLMSIQLIAKARDKGIMLSPNQLFDHQTIESLAAFISDNKGQEEQWDYLVALRKEGTKAPLFCIHAGGGHVFFYNKLTEHIDSDRPLYAIQPSGLYGDKQLHGSIEEMTSDYIRAMRSLQPVGPYNVMVYCFSAAVGHEMAIQMEQQGLDYNLIVVDTMVRPWSLNSPDRLKLRISGFIKRFFRNPFKSIRFMIEDRIWMIRPALIKWFGNDDQKALETLRTNLVKVCLAYDWKPHNTQISLILTKKPDERINTMILDSWKEEISADIKVLHTKGNHRTLFEKSDVPYVAKKIEECIREKKS
ncbi:MAG: thioesterase domain-containing protein [Bacteroidota bacterium]